MLNYILIPSQCQAKISKLADLRGQRVRVFGWVHRRRDQGGIMFVVLRDGTGYLQSVFSGRVVCIFGQSPPFTPQ